MAKVPINSFLNLRRLYAVAVEKNVRAQTVTAAAVMRKAATEPISSDVGDDEKKENFWMRDPNTGNWIPESHFGEIDDAAELRDKLLPKGNKHK